MARSRKKTPKVGETYKDHEGRKLRITEVNPDDPLGCQVRGKIRFPKRLADKMSFSYKRGYDYSPQTEEWEHVKYSHREEYDFSTTLEMWARTWRDKAPPANPALMKVG